MNSRKNVICKEEGDTWVKKENPEFDITMGNDDGAEACEMVGLFLLEQISDIIPKEDVGLYRDDGLATIEANGPKAARVEKKLHAMFKKYNLSIQVESNIKTTDFLDVILDLKTGTTRPYRKENDTPLYINLESNHPPCIKKQLPSMISKRLSGLSTSEVLFKEATPIYEKALNDAGYKEPLKYEKENQNNNTKRKRTRNITWFTPPFNQEVKTNITKEFLKILNKSFPEGNPLRKIFNKNTIKISYSTTKNMSQIIAAHNRKIIWGKESEIENCNCSGNPKICPVDEKCKEEGIIYQADVIAEQEPTKTYLGAAATSFKIRYGNHKKSFNNRLYEYDTELSKYIWELKDKEKDYQIKWNIIARANPYTPTSGKCNLCITEKTLIANYKGKTQLLNSRNDLMAKCRHRDKWLLSKWTRKAVKNKQNKAKNNNGNTPKRQKNPNKDKPTSLTAPNPPNNEDEKSKETIKRRPKKMNKVQAVQQTKLKDPPTSIATKNPPNNVLQDNLEIPTRRNRKSTKQKDFFYT